MVVKKIRSIMFSAAKDVVAVDISGDNLKLVHMKTYPGRRILENILSRSIIGMSDQDISGVIRTELSRLKLKNPEIISSAPTQATITQNIEIPATDPREIKNIVDLQAGRRTPYSREEMVFDHLEIGSYKHSYTKILLVIVPRKAVKRLYDIFSRSGSALSRVVFSPESFGLLVDKVFKTESERSPIGVIHVDEETTDFSVFSRKKLIFTRTITVGARNLLSEKDLYYQNFVDELKRSVEVYSGEDIDTSPAGYALTGAAEALEELRGMLAEALGSEIRLSPQYSGLGMAEGSSLSRPDTRNISFFHLAASLAGYREIKLRLIPEDVKLKDAIEKKGQQLVKTGAYVMAILVMVLFALANKIFFREDYLRTITKKYELTCVNAAKLEKEHSRVSLARHYLKTRRGYLDVIVSMGDIIPENVEISSVRIDEEGRFSARGVAETMSSVFFFVDAMSNSEYFRDVQTRYTAQRKDRETDRNVTDFEIVALVEKGKVK